MGQAFPEIVNIPSSVNRWVGDYVMYLHVYSVYSM